MTELSSAAYKKWLTIIIIGWLTRKSLSSWSKIRRARASNEKINNLGSE